jgi:hypothetical protein
VALATLAGTHLLKATTVVEVGTEQTRKKAVAVAVELAQLAATQAIIKVALVAQVQILTIQ